MSGEECPPAITAALLDNLASKMGEETSINSLQGVPQKVISLKINLKNLQLLQNKITGLGVTRDVVRMALVSTYAHLSSLYLLSTEWPWIYSQEMVSALHVHSTVMLRETTRSRVVIEGEIISRHNYLRDAIFTTAVQACLGRSRE